MDNKSGEHDRSTATVATPLHDVLCARINRRLCAGTTKRGKLDYHSRRKSAARPTLLRATEVVILIIQLLARVE